jgi:hypothetical protein
MTSPENLTDFTDPRFATKECLLCGSQVLLINAYPHTKNCLREYEERNNLQMFIQKNQPSSSLPIVSASSISPPSNSQSSENFLINKKCDLPNTLCPGTGANSKNFTIHFKEKCIKVCKLTDLKSTMVQNYLKQTCSNDVPSPGNIECNFCEQKNSTYVSVMVSSSCLKFCDLNCALGKLSVVSNSDFYPQEKKKNSKKKSNKRKRDDLAENSENSQEEEEEEVHGSKKKRKN